MFCPQCGVQVEQQTKFCKSCGLKLADHVQLIAASRDTEIGRMSREEAKRQLRWLKATRSLLGSALMVPLMMLTVGISALSRGPEEGFFGFISFFLVCLWLGINGRALFNLFRGGLGLEFVFCCRKTSFINVEKGDMCSQCDQFSGSRFADA